MEPTGGRHGGFHPYFHPYADAGDGGRAARWVSSDPAMQRTLQRTENAMIARLVVIGAALLVTGLTHLFGRPTWTAVLGGALLVVAGGLGVVRHRRGLPLTRLGGGRR